MNRTRLLVCWMAVSPFLLALAAGLAQEPRPPAEWTPNLIVQVHQTLAARLAEKPLNQVEDVRDNILKTDIYGKSQTRGTVTVEFVPCDNAAIIDLVMTAETSAQTTGYHGPVQLHNTSQSSIHARKRVYLDAEGVKFGPAESCNRTDSMLECITTKFQRPLMDNTVRRTAYRRYTKDQELARQISESHVDQRVRAGFDRDADPSLLAANRSYRETLRDPLQTRGIFPDHVSMSTTATTLVARYRLADAAAPSWPAPPALDGSPEASVRLHESFLNAATNTLFAGKTYTAETFRRDFPELRGPGPKRPAGGATDQKKFAITFAAKNPIEAHFDNDTVTIVVRGSRFQVDDDTFEGMSVTVAYRVEKSATGIKATRRGEIQVRPTNVAPGQRLTSSQVAAKAVLKHHLEEFLPPDIEQDELTLPESLQKAGKLVPTQLAAARGWLVFGAKVVATK